MKTMTNKMWGMIGAGLFLLTAPAIDITTDTVVTAADVATYAGAETIDIAAGAKLTFQNLTADVTFTATLTGEGEFVVSSAAASTVRVTFDGDATEFAGSFKIVNHVFTFTKPEAAGSALVDLSNTAKAKSYLSGSGTYRCPLKLNCSATNKYGLFIDEGVVLDAPITYVNGRINGPGTVSGLITIGRTMYLGESIRIAGDVKLNTTSTTVTWSILGDSTPYVIAGPLSKIPMILVTNAKCVFDGTNLLDPEQVLTLGGSNSKTGIYELNGFDQIAGRFEWKVAPTTDAEKAKNVLTSTSGPATLSLLNQTTVDYTGVVNDQLSLCVAGEGIMTLSGANNTTDGALIASNGFITVAENASFANLSTLAVKGTGTLTVNSANVNPGLVDVAFFDAGVLAVKEGLVLEVGHAFLNGAYLEAGTYTGDEGPLKGRLTGTLRVANGEPIEEGKTYVWVGGTADNDVTAGDNWAEGKAPSFNGRERLVFGTEQTVERTAKVVGDLPVYAIEIDAREPFALTAADTARLQLGVGGLFITNRLAGVTTTNTVTISCPIHVTTLPQEWTIGVATVLENQAPISSAEAVAPLTMLAHGRVIFRADNSGLLAPLEITEIYLTDSSCQPYVYHRYGLGATNRFTTLNGAFPRLLRTGTTGTVFVTNSTPLRVSVASTKTGYITYTSSSTDEYWQEGAVRIFGGGLCNIFVYGTCHFLGGIVHEDGGQVTFRLQKRDLYLDDKPIRMTGTLSTDYANTLHLNASGNMWGLFGLLKATVVCGAAEALDPTAEIRVGSNNTAYYAELMGALDLGGIDQSCSRIYRQWDPWATSKAWNACYARLTSETPAQLTVTSDKEDSLPVKVEGAAGVTFNGTGALAFTNFLSTTVGTLNVAQGTVRFDTGAGWTATTNVVIGAAGRLVVGAGTGATAFGPASGSSAANLTVAEGGVLEIAAGEQATVQTLMLANGEAIQTRGGGIYGGPEATVPVTRRVAWIAGAGTLKVLKPTGLVLLFQ